MKPDATADFFGRRVLVVGLGLHGGGEATVRWLVRHKAIVRVTDAQTAVALAPTVKRLRNLKVQWRLGKTDVADARWAQILVQNPGVPDANPLITWAARNRRPIMNEASIFFSYCRGPVIAVTGTRGKTTTTTLLYDMIRRHSRAIISGNVRQVAMLDQLDGLTTKHASVLELSSFQLERMPVARRGADVAVMTNLKVDHLNRYPSMQAYADAKYNLFRGQTPHGVAILNADDSGARAAAKHTSAKVLWFGNKLTGRQQGLTIRSGHVVAVSASSAAAMFPLSDWKMAGQHNTENLLAAATAAFAYGVPVRAIRAAVKAFRGVPYRQEVVRTWKHHQFINDTTATTPDGTLAAMDVYPDGLFILGGTDKRLQFSRLAAAIRRRKLPVVLLPGTATSKLRRAIGKPGQRYIHDAASMDEAVRVACTVAKARQPIVLSPGAASFGLFRHEFDRGDAFNRAVHALR